MPLIYKIQFAVILLSATNNGNPRTTIISCYSPTNASDEFQKREEKL